MAQFQAPDDTVTLRIDGMTCGGCTLATRKVLERLDGVRHAAVNSEEKRAVVIHDAAKVTVATMLAAVAALKYTVTLMPPASTATTSTPSIILPAGKP